MITHNFTHYLKASSLVILTLFLIACDRHDYVTWKCSSSDPQEKDFSFILEGSKMTLVGTPYSFCGSYGANSFFDTPCPSTPTDSHIMFHQKNGALLINSKPYKCKSL
jgi:hypothetical protein